MKARIDARAGAEGKDDLKLGQGRHPRGRVLRLGAAAPPRRASCATRAIRERAVLRALDRLLFAGIVQARDRDAISDAYLFLRRAEHRVQMVDGRQTHRLPPPEERLGAGPVHGLRRRGEVRGRPGRPPRPGGRALRRAARHPGRRGARSTRSWRCWPTSRWSRSAAGRSPRGAGFDNPDQAVAALDALARRRDPLLPHGRPGRRRGAPRRGGGHARPRPGHRPPLRVRRRPQVPRALLPAPARRAAGRAASWSRSSAPPTSSPSASCATPSWSTSCCATTRWCWRRTWPTFRDGDRRPARHACRRRPRSTRPWSGSWPSCAA